CPRGGGAATTGRIARPWTSSRLRIDQADVVGRHLSMLVRAARSLEPRARVAGTTVVEEHDAHQELRIGLVLETALVEGALERGGGRVPVLALHVHLGETHVKVAVVRELGGTLERRNRTLELPRRDPAVRELLIR